MTNNIVKIRAALEMARDYITSDLASERGAFEGYEGLSRIDEIKADLKSNESALAALAELEKAAGEPVAWMWNDMLGISHTYVSPKRPTWPDAGASPEMEMAINVRPLYAAPPAPVAEIREVVVTDEMCDSAYLRKWESQTSLSGAEPDDEDRQWAREWLAAWRAELGPQLGLVTRAEMALKVEELRDLLELAARAMGLNLIESDLYPGDLWIPHPDDPRALGVRWNPRENSSQCAAMCAALGIDTIWWDTYVRCDFDDIDTDAAEHFRDHNGDKSAAWRLAALRVAADIGRGMRG